MTKRIKIQSDCCCDNINLFSRDNLISYLSEGMCFTVAYIYNISGVVVCHKFLTGGMTLQMRGAKIQLAGYWNC